MKFQISSAQCCWKSGRDLGSEPREESAKAPSIKTDGVEESQGTAGCNCACGPWEGGVRARVSGCEAARGSVMQQSLWPQSQQQQMVKPFAAACVAGRNREPPCAQPSKKQTRIAKDLFTMPSTSDQDFLAFASACSTCFTYLAGS